MTEDQNPAPVEARLAEVKRRQTEQLDNSAATLILRLSLETELKQSKGKSPNEARIEAATLCKDELIGKQKRHIWSNNDTAGIVYLNEEIIRSQEPSLSQQEVEIRALLVEVSRLQELKDASLRFGKPPEVLQSTQFLLEKMAEMKQAQLEAL